MKKEKDNIGGRPFQLVVPHEKGCDCEQCRHREEGAYDKGLRAHENALTEGRRRYGTLINAYGRRTISGHPEGEDMAYVHCQTCNEAITEKGIVDHLHGGHDVEIVMKPPKNKH